MQVQNRSDIDVRVRLSGVEDIEKGFAPRWDERRDLEVDTVS